VDGRLARALEGNTLVVDVANNNGQTWFTIIGDFHTDALHVTERWTPTAPDHIVYVATVEDPNVYTRRGNCASTTAVRWSKSSGRARYGRKQDRGRRPGRRQQIGWVGQPLAEGDHRWDVDLSGRSCCSCCPALHFLPPGSPGSHHHRHRQGLDGGGPAGRRRASRPRRDGTQFEAFTDERGAFRIPVRIGVYRITAELTGFATLQRAGLEVQVGQQVTVNLEMTPSAIAESVTVTGEAPLVTWRPRSWAQHRFTAAVGAAGQRPQLLDLTMLAPGARANHTDPGGCP